MGIFLAGPALGGVAAGLLPQFALLKDFGQDYLLSRAIGDRIDPYTSIAELATRYLEPAGYLDKTFATPHPPSLGLLLLPLTVFDYLTSIRVWFAVNLASLVLGVGLALNNAGFHIKWRMVPLIAVALLSWTAIGQDLMLGQVTTLLLVLLAASQSALQRHRSILSGGLLGLALLVKPVAWPWLILLVVQRRWSALATTGAVGVLGLLAPMCFVGYAPIVKYFTRVLPQVSAQYAGELTNISLATIGPRMFIGTHSAYGRVAPLVDSPALASWVSVGIALLVIIVATVLIIHLRLGIQSGLGVMTCVCIVATPVSWQYDLVLAIIPFAQALALLQRANYHFGLTCALAVIGAAVFMSFDFWYQLGVAISGGAAVTLGPSLLTLGPSFAVTGMMLVLGRGWRTRSAT